jgi:hypothetical protein
VRLGVTIEIALHNDRDRIVATGAVLLPLGAPLCLRVGATGNLAELDPGESAGFECPALQDADKFRGLCRANRRAVEILVRRPELRRFIRKIVSVEDAEGLEPRHWCLLIPGRRPALQSIL